MPPKKFFIKNKMHTTLTKHVLTVAEHLCQSSVDEGQHLVRHHADFVHDDTLAVSEAMTQFVRLLRTHLQVLDELIRRDVEQPVQRFAMDVRRGQA